MNVTAAFFPTLGGGFVLVGLHRLFVIANPPAPGIRPLT
jgi:hypothetical protein